MNINDITSRLITAFTLAGTFAWMTYGIWYLYNILLTIIRTHILGEKDIIILDSKFRKERQRADYYYNVLKRIAKGHCTAGDSCFCGGCLAWDHLLPEDKEADLKALNGR